MLHLLNEDCLLRISRELVSDLSSSALIPFIQTNRFLYNLASHYLLLCPASYTYSGIHIGLEGDTESDERVEGFRDFVLGVNFYRSRVPHLHRLIVTIPSMEDIEDIENPRLSKRSINALAEVFNPALHHQPQHAPTAQPPIVLERFAMWPLVDSFGTLDDMFPIPSLLAKIPTLHELVCTSRGTLDSISHQDIKAPLSTLSLEVEDPGTDFRTCDLLVNLSSVRQSLRRLYLNAHECFTFGFARGTKIPVYPSLLEFVARVWDLHIPTRVLVEAFPNLKNLSLDVIGRSIFPSDCLQWPVDDDDSWGMENSLYSHIRRENQRDLEQYGHEQWKELDEVQGSVRTLYSLDLTCKVKTLTIYSDGLYEEDMAQDVCESMKPESLHFLCILTRALPSVTSAITGCTGSLRDFHLETSLNVEVKNWGSWEIWYAEITEFFEAVFSALHTTDVKDVDIHIRLDGVWRSKDWEYRDLDDIIDTKDFSPMRCFFYYFLNTSPQIFMVETMERLRGIDRLCFRTSSHMEREGKDGWLGVEWNLEEKILGRGLPTSERAAGRPIELDKVSANEEMSSDCLDKLELSDPYDRD